MKFLPCFFLCINCIFLCANEKVAGAATFFTDGDLSQKRGEAFFSNGTLRRYFDESERLLTDLNLTNTLHCSDNMLVQKKRDSLRRLVKKNVWKPSFPRPVLQTEYFYKADDPFPEKAETRDIENEKLIYEFYGEKGLFIKRDTYQLSEKSAGQTEQIAESGDEEKKLLCTETAAYDDLYRISEYSALYIQTKPRIEKTEYLYRRGGSKADVFYYINGVKTRQKIYASEKDWEETVFFPVGVKILTVYKNETAAWEIFYEGDIKKRERKL